MGIYFYLTVLLLVLQQLVGSIPLDQISSPNSNQPIAAPESAGSLNVSYFFGSSERAGKHQLETQLAPTLARGSRSASFGGLGVLALLPLFQGLLQQQTAARQEPTDTAATTTASPLAALLPLLLAGGGGSSAGSLGSFGSIESIESREAGAGGINSLLTALAALTTTAAPAAANMIASPGKANKLHLLEGTNKGAAPDWKYSHDDPNAAECVARNRSAVCDNLPVDKILALRNAVIVTKGQSIYRVKPNGEPIDMKPTIFDVKIEPITATAQIKNFFFVFQGDQYTKFDANLKQAPGKFPRQINSGFPGVISPVDGVFQLNNHTYVFISGSKFVYFQPDANPNVDPKYSPQYLENVPGAPNSVDSVFTIKDRKFLYKNGIIYEMAPEEMKVFRETPVVSSSEKTWLKCPDIFPAHCSSERLVSLPVLNVTETPIP